MQSTRFKLGNETLKTLMAVSSIELPEQPLSSTLLLTLLFPTLHSLKAPKLRRASGLTSAPLRSPKKQPSKCSIHCPSQAASNCILPVRTHCLITHCADGQRLCTSLAAVSAGDPSAQVMETRGSNQEDKRSDSPRQKFQTGRLILKLLRSHAEGNFQQRLQGHPQPSRLPTETQLETQS